MAASPEKRAQLRRTLADISAMRRASEARERDRQPRHTISVAVRGSITASTGASFRSFSALDLQAALRRDRFAPVVLTIDSPGGMSDEGLRMHEALRAHKGEVATRVQGRCDSAATLVLAAGRWREVPHDARMLIHMPAYDEMQPGQRYDPAALRRLADTADAYAERMATAYASATGTPRHVWLGLMQGDTVLKPYDAAMYGLVNIVGGQPLNLSRWRA